MWLLIDISHRPIEKVNIGFDVIGTRGLKSAKTSVYNLIKLKWQALNFSVYIVCSSCKMYL